MSCEPNEHKFVFQGYHIKGEKRHGTSVPYLLIYEEYFCEKCGKKKSELINQGIHANQPTGAPISYSGYGFH